jgi:hypothetical protein
MGLDMERLPEEVMVVKEDMLYRCINPVAR